MNNFNSAFKKLWDWIEHNISMIASIMGILCFFGIDYSKIKPFILLAINKFKNCVYRVKEDITYKCINIEIIMYKQYLNFMKKIDGTINYLMKSLFPLSSCCILLIIISIYNPFGYLNRVWNGETIVNSNDFNQLFLSEGLEYTASGNVNQLNQKDLIEKKVETTKPRTGAGYKLELEYPYGHSQISDNEFEELYNSIFYSDEEYLEEIIKYEIEILKNSCTENTQLDEEAAKRAYIYSEIEQDIFYKNDKSISSDLLEQIICGRRELFELYPNEKLSWLLANSYQTYAYNYLKQTNSSKSILYFYMQSIYYAKTSLEFDMETKVKETRIKYIQMRYKDIADCMILNDEVRFRAYEVYNAIDNTLTTLNMEN